MRGALREGPALPRAFIAEVRARLALAGSLPVADIRAGSASNHALLEMVLKPCRRHGRCGMKRALTQVASHRRRDFGRMA